MRKRKQDKTNPKQGHTSSKKENLSHPDKSLNSDYRPTSQGSTDYDRNSKKEKEK